MLLLLTLSCCIHITNSDGSPCSEVIMPTGDVSAVIASNNGNNGGYIVFQDTVIAVKTTIIQPYLFSHSDSFRNLQIVQFRSYHDDDYDDGSSCSAGFVLTIMMVVVQQYQWCWLL